MMAWERRCLNEVKSTALILGCINKLKVVCPFSCLTKGDETARFYNENVFEYSMF